MTEAAADPHKGYSSACDNIKGLTGKKQYSFYSRLPNTIDMVSKGNAVKISGDFNARVDDEYSPGIKG